MKILSSIFINFIQLDMKSARFTMFNYIFSLFIVSLVLPGSLSYDIELEGIVRLGKDAFRTLTDKDYNDFEKEERLETQDIPHSINVRNNNNLPKKIQRSNVMRAMPSENNTMSELIQYLDHAKEIGTIVLKKLGKEIMNEMKLDNINSDEVTKATDSYIMALQKYYQNLMDQKAKYHIDNELVFLDMVDTVCVLLYQEQKKLLSAILMVAYYTKPPHDSTDSIEILSKSIYKKHVHTKTMELQHVCNRYEICRPFPGLSDYIADFIVDVLRLTNNKLEAFAKLVKFYANLQRDFFETISGEKERVIIYNQVSKMFENVNSIRESLSVIRGIITHRFKIIQNSNLSLKLRTDAMRLVIAILDKAFTYEREDLLAIDFDTAVRAIREWARSDRKELPESIMVQLMNFIVKTLNYNLSDNAKEELKVLIEVITKDSSTKYELFKSLFTDGSKYVKGEDYHPDIAII